MWRNADPDWLYLDHDRQRGLTITRGRAGDASSAARCSISPETWNPAWYKYRAASEAAEGTFSTFETELAPDVEAAYRRLRSACETLYRLLADAVGADLGSDRFVVARSQPLAALTLARLVAVASPELLRARLLPWDLPAGCPERAAPTLARAVTTWKLPAAAELTILAPEALELERVFPVDLTDTRAVGWAAAIVARWAVAYDQALRDAEAAGAQVIRSATSGDLLDTLQGRHRDAVQIVGHVDKRWLHLHDGRLSLRGFAAAVDKQVAAGWRSPVKVLDLSTCGSPVLFATLQRAGIEYISGRLASVHLGAMSKWLHRLHTRRFLDGATPIAHAWLLAALT